ncbi:MAG: hypothetical protein ACFNUJ_07560, partial [Campylobacter curvus]
NIIHISFKISLIADLFYLKFLFYFIFILTIFARSKIAVAQRSQDEIEAKIVVEQDVLARR